MSENELITCEICECKYKQTIMPGRKLSGDMTCPTLRIAKNQMDTCGELWRERTIKHHPEWAD